MPIEARDDHPAQDAPETSVGAAFLAEARRTLQGSLRKIAHCLDQLPEDDLGWRAHEAHNSIRNILLHLRGNLRQWILHGLGGAPDVRDRPAEFRDRRPIPRAELLGMLREAVAGVDHVLAGFPPERLMEARRIQGFETTALGAVFDAVSHFVGHTHQVVFITRLRLGAAYRFQWTPAGIEQGGPAEPKVPGP